MHCNIYTAVFLSLYNLAAGLPVYTANEKTVWFTVLADWGGIPEFPYRTSIEKAVGRAMGEVADLLGSQFTLALGLQNPWYVVAGNHDHNRNISAQKEYSKISDRWNFPDTNYSLAFPIPDSNSTLMVLMIDTVILCGNSDDTLHAVSLGGPAEQTKAKEHFEWIEQTLRKSNDDYIIVGGHYPMWSIAEHGPTECLVNNLKPILEKYQVAAYISGHDHNMQHIKDNTTVEYFVVGSGAIVDPSTEHLDAIPKGSLKFHSGNPDSLGGFGFVEMSPQNATFTFIDASAGKDLYQAVLLPRSLS